MFSGEMRFPSGSMATDIETRNKPPTGAASLLSRIAPGTTQDRQKRNNGDRNEYHRRGFIAYGVAGFIIRHIGINPIGESGSLLRSVDRAGRDVSLKFGGHFSKLFGDSSKGLPLGMVGREAGYQFAVLGIDQEFLEFSLQIFHINPRCPAR